MGVCAWLTSPWTSQWNKPLKRTNIVLIISTQDFTPIGNNRMVENIHVNSVVENPGIDPVCEHVWFIIQLSGT